MKYCSIFKVFPNNCQYPSNNNTSLLFFLITITISDLFVSCTGDNSKTEKINEIEK